MSLAPLAALPKELHCLIADSLQSEDLCSTMEACKDIRDALLAKHWRRAATWAASRRFSLGPAEKTKEGEAELRRSLSILLHCSSYLGYREAIECAILFHLIAEATGCRRLAKDIRENSPLANFRLARPINICTNYKTSLQPPLQSSYEAVVVGYLDAAAKFDAQTVIQYLRERRAPGVSHEKQLSALINALSVAVVYNNITAAEQLIKYGASGGNSVRCEVLQVGGGTYRPPRGCVNQLCIAVLHEHEDMVRYLSKTMCHDDCSYELQEGLEVARKFKLTRLEQIIAEVKNWQLVNSRGVRYNLERCGYRLDIQRPW